MLAAKVKETNPSHDQICRRFSLDEIRSATQDFNEEMIIGRGRFGMVYKGQMNLESTTQVAIKRLHMSSDQGTSEFGAELKMLSKLRHCNLVSLIGYCNEGVEMILVYEYMPRGTLEDHLHKADVPRLSWLQRLKICVGVARALDYLHTGTGTKHGIIHRDVKSSNILLDENFAAKVSDFGLAKVGVINQTGTYVSTGVKGTFGYMDPRYFCTGKLTRKSDVYSFGVILLEVICGRPAVDTSLDEEQWSLATWAQDHIEKRNLNVIIDSRLKGQISSNILEQFGYIACCCLCTQQNQRPTMAEIIVSLELILSLQQQKSESSVPEGKKLLPARLLDMKLPGFGGGGGGCEGRKGAQKPVTFKVPESDDDFSDDDSFDDDDDDDDELDVVPRVNMPGGGAPKMPNMMMNLQFMKGGQLPPQLMKGAPQVRNRGRNGGEKGGGGGNGNIPVAMNGGGKKGVGGVHNMNGGNQNHGGEAPRGGPNMNRGGVGGQNVQNKNGVHGTPNMMAMRGAGGGMGPMNNMPIGPKGVFRGHPPPPPPPSRPPPPRPPMNGGGRGMGGMGPMNNMSMGPMGVVQGLPVGPPMIHDGRNGYYQGAGPGAMEVNPIYQQQLAGAMMNQQPANGNGRFQPFADIKFRIRLCTIL